MDRGPQDIRKCIALASAPDAQAALAEEREARRDSYHSRMVRRDRSQGAQPTGTQARRAGSDHARPARQTIYLYRTVTSADVLDEAQDPPRRRASGLDAKGVGYLLGWLLATSRPNWHLLVITLCTTVTSAVILAAVICTYALSFGVRN